MSGDQEDIRTFWSSFGAVLRLFGEETAFDLLGRLQDAGIPGWADGDVGDTISPLYVRFSASRRFGDAQALHDMLTRQGRPLWPASFDARHAAALARGVPPIMLATLPKSGSVYLLRTLSHMLQVPEIRTSLSRFPEDYTLAEALQVFRQGGCISQSHMDASAANLDALAAAGINRIHVHVRDPRQATVSWAAHVASFLVGEQRYLRHLTDPPMPDGLDQWPEEHRLEWFAANHFPACLRWTAQWLHTADHDSRFRIGITDQAHLQADPLAVVRQILVLFGADPGSVTDAVIPAPRAGVANFRQGTNDEWRHVLPPGLQDWMNRMIPGQMAQRFGWPPD